MTFTLFILLFISSFLGSLWGFCLFLLFCKIFKPNFYNYMMLEREFRKAPMKDRRRVETYSSNPDLTTKKQEPIKSFMSAVSDSQKFGGDMLFSKEQNKFGSDKTIYDMCNNEELPEDEYTTEKMYEIFKNEDPLPSISAPVPIRSVDEEDDTDTEYNETEFSELEDDGDESFQVELKSKYQKPVDNSEAKNKNSKDKNNDKNNEEEKENVTLSISPGATGGNAPKRKRGRPPKTQGN